jgi:surfactin synthase thioesterase subunit
MSTVVEAIVAAVDFAPPFALFGHSLGGLVAFEVARALTRRGNGPDHLFVSAVPAPDVRCRPPTHLHALPDDAFLVEVERRWGRLAEPVRENLKLRALVLGYLRADVEIFETYEYAPSAPLDCPITTVRGTAEPDIDMSGWSRHTRGPAVAHELPGGHFYLRDQRDALTGLIRAAYARRP